MRCSYHLEGLLELGQCGPGLELAVLYVAQGMFQSPLAEAGGQVTQADVVASPVSREYSGP